jgi:exonuclease SbcD
VALGHLHRYQNLNPNGYPAIIYAGSPERIDFGERKEDKGFCLVTIESKGKTHHEFIKTPTRPFIQIEVHLKAGIDQTDQILEEISHYTTTDAIVKILYHVPEGKRDHVDLKKVQRACEEAMFLVGVIPIRTFTTRERRLAMNIDMDLKTLLTTYFLSKPELKDKSTDLVEKALELYEESQEEKEL